MVALDWAPCPERVWPVRFPEVLAFFLMSSVNEPLRAKQVLG